MTKPRTTPQRYADYRKTFPKRVNDRRCELIAKMYSGFTEEESERQFSRHPGWEEEFDRRVHANLTDAERAELAECERVMDGWAAAAPWTADQQKFIEEKEAEFRASMAKHGVPPDTEKEGKRGQ